ncbi:kinase-like domain-containing protein [Lactarius quietus]|nr:kinase-like domain-containing protein [Lactarius quietus]
MSDSDECLPTYSIHVCGRYRVKKLLGWGTSGNVYLGWDIKTGQDVALKLEPMQSVYKVLSNVAGIPTMHWFGREEPYNVIILDCLGYMLEEAVSNCNDIGIIFFTGKLRNKVFLINFGLAQLFRDPFTHQHILLVSGVKTIGTITFTSINSHLGQDIIEEGSVEQYEVAILKKKTAVAKTLCQGLPLPFVTFTQYIQSLSFDEKLQYNHLHTLLMQCSAHDPNSIVSGPSFTLTVSPSLHELGAPGPCLITTW